MTITRFRAIHLADALIDIATGSIASFTDCQKLTHSSFKQFGSLTVHSSRASKQSLYAPQGEQPSTGSGNRPILVKQKSAKVCIKFTLAFFGLGMIIFKKVELDCE